MNHWLFTITAHKDDGKTISAEEIYHYRMDDEFWGIVERTPNRKNVKVGDRIVFYVGLPDMVFRGTAEVARVPFKMSAKEVSKYSHGRTFYKSEYGITLTNIQRWTTPKPTKEIIGQLTFVENPEHWYAYFQGGVRGLSEQDFKTIAEGADVPLHQQLSTSRDIESESQFALEAHLEEFLSSNWSHIEWGQKLELYEFDGQVARQFPAGTWSIDFLAIDKRTKTLVVIELKRGRTSDTVIGQLMRYMAWVKENVADKEQSVSGIIVAKEIDASLKYAASLLPNVKLLTYAIDFTLHSS